MILNTGYIYKISSDYYRCNRRCFHRFYTGERFLHQLCDFYRWLPYCLSHQYCIYRLSNYLMAFTAEKEDAHSIAAINHETAHVALQRFASCALPLYVPPWSWTHIAIMRLVALIVDYPLWREVRWNNVSMFLACHFNSRYPSRLHAQVDRCLILVVNYSAIE